MNLRRSRADAERVESVALERQHGGPDFAELQLLGIDPEAVTDFSVSVNPYGPGESIERAIRSAPIQSYPDPTCAMARRALGALLGVDTQRIVIGHGATELLWVLGRLYGGRGDRVLFVEPTFSEMKAAVRATGGEVVDWRATEDNDFDIDLNAVARAVEATNARSIYLCLPASPTGRYVPMDEVATWARSLPTLTIVLDQAFLSLSETAADCVVALPDNVVVLRSPTKELGVPGVRVGYALARRSLAQAMERQRPCWSISSAAQAAIIAACEEPSRVEEARLRMLGDRVNLLEALRRAGLNPLPTVAPYCVARVATEASHVRRTLLEDHGILVRDCRSFGMPCHLRFCARPVEDVRRLAIALNRVL